MAMLKTPKGTADNSPRESFLCEDILDKLKTIFSLHGAVPISTPTFELKSTLVSKYGKEEKLIYDLKDQGGEECALRYDLTVPLSRYLVTNSIRRFKRYQIGHVFRRDNPSVTKGRLREFVQADFDIVGESPSMFSDAEVLSCVSRIMRSFNIGGFVIKISDRRILQSVLRAANVEEKKHNTVYSAIDKIEKIGFDEVEEELAKKELSKQQIGVIRKYVKMSGTEDVIALLKLDEIYQFDECKQAVNDFEDLFKLCKIFGCYGDILIDLSLARGLDYYTGIVFEAVFHGSSVGSVIGGGRYDNLTDCLSGGKFKAPCVGFSVGVSRVLTLILDRYDKESRSVVYVGACGGIFLEKRAEVLRMLWDAGIAAETFYTRRVSFSDQKVYAKKKGIQFIAFFGESELVRGSVNVINLYDEQKEEIKLSDLLEYVLGKQK